MKRLIIYIILLTITSLLLDACNKEKEVGKKNKDLLIGTWSTTQFELELRANDISIEAYLIDSLGLSAQEVTVAASVIKSEVADLFENQTITFTSEQTYETSLNNEVQTGTWTLSDDQKLLTIFVLEDFKIDLEITSISDEVLQLRINQSLQTEDIMEESNYTTDLLPEIIGVQGEFTLIKQN